MNLRKADDERSREFWASATEARREVEEWPEWKRNIRVTKFSTGFDQGNGRQPASKNQEP